MSPVNEPPGSKRLPDMHDVPYDTPPSAGQGSKLIEDMSMTVVDDSLYSNVHHTHDKSGQ